MTARILISGVVVALAGLSGCAGQNDDNAARKSASATAGSAAGAKRPQPAAKPVASTATTAQVAKPAVKPATKPRDTVAVSRSAERRGGDAELAEIPDHDRAKDERDRQRRVEKRRREARQNLRDVRRENEREASKFRATLTSTQLRALRGFRSRLARRERDYLSPFHRRLRSFAASNRRERLVILQIGDSHTASDNFSGYLRERLQRRFGDGGRGMLAAGVPYRYFQPFQVRASQTKGWTVQSSRRTDAIGPFGITGYVAESDDPEDVMTLSMRGMASFRYLEIEYLTSRRGGSFTVQIDKKIVRTISTKGRRGMARVVIEAPRGAWFAAVRPKGGRQGAPAVVVDLQAPRRTGLRQPRHQRRDRRYP